AEFILYRHYIIWDHAKQKCWEYEISYDGEGIGEKFFFEETATVPGFVEKGDEKEDYITRIDRIIEYIRAGDVYEVNLTRPFSFPFSDDAFAFFEKLYRKNPAPFSAYIDGGAFQVVSNSPEMFLRAKGRRVETRPIKGTVPTSPDVEKDEANRDFLLSSPKEEAELFMIIDLLRNDLARVSCPGSVKVIHEKRCEKYQNVYHLVGVIQSLLQKRKDYADLFRAAFPGGSITGCPKIRSIEIIRELEQRKRHLYTGSIVMMNSQSLISSIAIRTAVVSQGRIFFNAGGAVTVASDPEREYEEVLAKVSNFLEVFI
ncbi:MAG TPA: anthranilate synthase component I family protein, partial [Candidatus Mcinerneyibacteriales bacterium]|nr:anthranilate synthase component I family protein [Candidatus Mcinerneyibacteriales bacterium]